MEKALKKVKIWLDGGEKLKHRHSSLLQFLELTSEQEQSTFFRDKRVVLYEYSLECYRQFSAKLASDVEYKELTERVLSGGKQKEIQDFIKAPLAVSLCFRYAPMELLNGPEERFLSDLVNVVSGLLHANNHPVLRREGIALTLIWLKDIRLVPGIFREIFGAAVRLQPLLGEEHQHVQSPTDSVAGPSRTSPPLVQSPLAPIQQSVQALRDLLQLITFEGGFSLSKASIIALYQYFREAYLDPFYVGQSASAPELLQSVVIEYFSLWIVQSVSNTGPVSIPVSCFMLTEYLLSTDSELKLVHSVIQQAYLLPFQHSHGIRRAMGIVKQWVLVSRERKPDFLNRPENTLQYMSLYLSMNLSVFDSRPSIGHQQDQIQIYREALGFLRAFVSVNLSSPDLMAKSVAILLAIAKKVFCPYNKYSAIVTPGVAEDFAGFFGETLWISLIKCQIYDEALWRGIAQIAQGLYKWIPIVNEWSIIVLKLTDLMSDVFFSSKKRQSLEDSQSGRSSPRPNDFSLWFKDASLLNDNERIVFLWKNLLTVFGSMRSINAPEAHFLITKTFVNISQALCELRQKQPFDAVCVPPVFELFPLLSEAAGQEDLQFIESRRLSAKQIGQMMFSRKIAISVPDNYVHLYCDNIIQGLSSGDLQLKEIVIEAASGCLANEVSYVLIPHLLKSITMVECRPFSIAVQCLSDIAIKSMECKETAWNALVAFYRYYKQDFVSLDIILPAISTVACSFLATGDHERLKQAIGILCETLSPPVPEDYKIPQSSTACLETVFMSIRDHSGKQGFDSDLEKFIFQKILLSIRSTLISYKAGNPTEPLQDRLGAQLLTLIPSFLDSMPCRWLKEEQQCREQLLAILEDCLKTHSERSLNTQQAANLVLGYLLHSFFRATPIDLNALTSKKIHFLVNEEAILTLSPTSFGRAILQIRNVVGQFSWEIELITGGAESLPHSAPIVNANVQDRVERYDAGPWPVDRDSHEFNRLPKYSNAIDLSSTDILADLLNYLYGQETVSNNSSAGDEQIRYESRKRFSAELKLAELYEEAVMQNSDQALAAYEHSLATAPSNRDLAPPYVPARQWMAAMGFLTGSMYTSKRIEPLSADVEEELSKLDLLPSKFTLSSGLYYLAPGQEQLDTTKKISSAYYDFIESLGWTDGENRVYADSIVEIKWNELNTNQDNQVIWNEHARDYAPDCKFALVVTPQSVSGMCTVQEYTKGNLTSSKQVSLAIVSPLIRSRIIATLSTRTIQHPYTVRANALINIKKRFGRDQSAVGLSGYLRNLLFFPVLTAEKYYSVGNELSSPIEASRVQHEFEDKGEHSALAEYAGVGCSTATINLMF